MNRRIASYYTFILTLQRLDFHNLLECLVAGVATGNIPEYSGGILSTKIQ